MGNVLGFLSYALFFFVYMCEFLNINAPFEVNVILIYPKIHLAP